MIRMTTLYPVSAGSFFDMAYYLEQHMPLAQQRLTEYGFLGYQVQQPAPGLDGSEPAYYCVTHSDFRSREDLLAGLQACGAELKADFARYTDIAPQVIMSSLLQSASSD